MSLLSRAPLPLPPRRCCLHDHVVVGAPEVRAPGLEPARPRARSLLRARVVPRLVDDDAAPVRLTSPAPATARTAARRRIRGDTAHHDSRTGAAGDAGTRPGHRCSSHGPVATVGVAGETRGRPRYGRADGHTLATNVAARDLSTYDTASPARHRVVDGREHARLHLIDCGALGTPRDRAPLLRFRSRGDDPHHGAHRRAVGGFPCRPRSSKRSRRRRAAALAMVAACRVEPGLPPLRRRPRGGRGHEWRRRGRACRGSADPGGPRSWGDDHAS